MRTTSVALNTTGAYSTRGLRPALFDAGPVSLSDHLRRLTGEALVQGSSRLYSALILGCRGKIYVNSVPDHGSHPIARLWGHMIAAANGFAINRLRTARRVAG